MIDLTAHAALAQGITQQCKLVGQNKITPAQALNTIALLAAHNPTSPAHITLTRERFRFDKSKGQNERSRRYRERKAGQDPTGHVIHAIRAPTGQFARAQLPEPFPAIPEEEIEFTLPDDWGPEVADPGGG